MRILIQFFLYVVTLSLVCCDSCPSHELILSQTESLSTSRVWDLWFSDCDRNV